MGGDVTVPDTVFLSHAVTLRHRNNVTETINNLIQPINTGRINALLHWEYLANKHQFMTSNKEC